MPQSDQPTRRELTTHLEEVDLWDLEDDWDDDEIADGSPSTTMEEPVPPSTEELDRQESEPEATTPLSAEPPSVHSEHLDSTPHSAIDEVDPSDLPSTPTPDAGATHPIPQENEQVAPPKFQSSPPNTTEEETEPRLSPTTEEKDTTDATTPSLIPQLSLIEKVALSLVISALIGLGIYSYIWLYEKNFMNEPATLKLPIKGDHVTLTAFSTYWTSAKESTDVKMGAQVLPATRITLDPATPSTAALRIHFRNKDNERVGDSITLPIQNGHFTPSQHSNIIISEDGLTANITSSDGFHQEGDFSAYMLDDKLAWKIFIAEASSEDAHGKDFKEIIERKVEPYRK